MSDSRKFLGMDGLSLLSSIPVMQAKTVPVACDLCHLTLEEMCGRVGITFGCPGCLIVSSTNMFNALRLTKDLPQNVCVAVIDVQSADGWEWMLVGPTGRAIYSPGA